MKVLIYRGIQGSGKTTLAKHQASCNPSYYFSTDDFWHREGGDYKFDPAKLDEAHSWNFRRFLTSLTALAPFQTNDVLIVDNTNITTVELAPYVMACKAFGVDFEILTVWSDPEVAWKRNTHNVPFVTILRRYAQLLKEELPIGWKHTVIWNPEHFPN